MLERAILMKKKIVEAGEMARIFDVLLEENFCVEKRKQEKTERRTRFGRYLEFSIFFPRAILFFFAHTHTHTHTQKEEEENKETENS